MGMEKAVQEPQLLLLLSQRYQVKSCSIGNKTSMRINSTGRFRMLNWSYLFEVFVVSQCSPVYWFCSTLTTNGKSLFWEWNRLFRTDWSSWTFLTNNVKHPGFHIHCKQYLSLLRFSGKLHRCASAVCTFSHACGHFMSPCFAWRTKKKERLLVVWVPHCRRGYTFGMLYVLFFFHWS